MEAVFAKEIISSKTLCRFIGLAVFVVFTCLGAFVRIPLPFSPVPITLQTFFVLLSAAFLGTGLGLLSQLSYCLLGILGLPVFTGAGSGWLYLSGPTAGYLFGFILAAFFVGRRLPFCRNKFLSVSAVFFLASQIILLCGSVWLKLTTGLSLAKVLFIGYLPFLPGDSLKVIVAATVYLRFKGRIKEIF